MRTSFTLICLFLIVNLAYSQSEKTIKALGIVTKETWRHTTVKTKYLDKIEKYDDNGNLIEEIEYNSEKIIKKHYQWTYNQNNDITSEIELDSSGKVIRKTVYEYDGKLKTSRKEYDNKGKLVYWKTYTYITKDKE